MRKFGNVVLLTQNQTYAIVKNNIREAFQNMLDEFIDGNETKNFFESVFNLKENFEKMEMFFRDICALQIFAETGAELIIITSSNHNAVISREPYQEKLDKTSARIIKLDQINEETQMALSS